LKHSVRLSAASISVCSIHTTRSSQPCDIHYAVHRLVLSTSWSSCPSCWLAARRHRSMAVVARHCPERSWAAVLRSSCVVVAASARQRTPRLALTTNTTHCTHTHCPPHSLALTENIMEYLCILHTQTHTHRQTQTHTHTRTFNGPFSGTTQVSRYQKGKTNLDFTKARDSEWQ